MTAPIVFISYSHDTPEHKRWVLDFAIRLRTSGIDAILDQWDLTTGGDLPLFMEQGIKRSAWTIMICTERYVDKANSGVGGVGYEKMIVTADLIGSIGSASVIPVVRQSGAKKVLPTFLSTKKYIDLSNADVFESGMDELLRHLLNAPLYEKPPIGNDPFKVINKPPVQKAPSPVDQFMHTVGNLYSQIIGSQSALKSETILREMHTTRLLFEYARDLCESEHLILTSNDNSTVWITEQGRAYLVEKLSRG